MSKLLNPEEMTSRDYYFDSYAHFGIHEVTHSGWGPAGGTGVALPSYSCFQRWQNMHVQLSTTTK